MFTISGLSICDVLNQMSGYGMGLSMQNPRWPTGIKLGRYIIMLMSNIHPQNKPTNLKTQLFGHVYLT